MSSFSLKISGYDENNQYKTVEASGNSDDLDFLREVAKKASNIYFGVKPEEEEKEEELQKKYLSSLSELLDDIANDCKIVIPPKDATRTHVIKVRFGSVPDEETIAILHKLKDIGCRVDKYDGNDCLYGIDNYDMTTAERLGHALADELFAEASWNATVTNDVW